MGADVEGDSFAEGVKGFFAAVHLSVEAEEAAEGGDLVVAVAAGAGEVELGAEGEDGGFGGGFTGARGGRGGGGGNFRGGGLALDAFDGGAHFGGGGVAVVGFFFAGFPEDGHPVGGEVGAGFAGVGEFFVELAAHDVGGIFGDEGGLAAEEGVPGGGESVEVAAAVDGRGGADLFRGGVGGRADEHAGVGELGIARGGVGEDAGEAEVAEFE